MTSAFRAAVGLVSGVMVSMRFPRNRDRKAVLCHRMRGMSSGVAGHVSVRLFGVDVILRRTLSPALSHRERGFSCFFRWFFLFPSPWSPSPVGEPTLL